MKVKTLCAAMNAKPFWHSIFKVQEEVKNLLLTKNELSRIASLDFNLLENLITFLKDYKECSEKLRSDEEPTMHIYPLYFQKLVENCSSNCFDSTIVQDLKKETLKGLEARFSSSAIHLVGLFLNPPYKEMFFLPQFAAARLRHPSRHHFALQPVPELQSF